jgi:hypothetical protein
MTNDQRGKDTSDASSPEAPQTFEYAEEHELEPDDQLQPGPRSDTPESAGTAPREGIRERVNKNK